MQDLDRSLNEDNMRRRILLRAVLTPCEKEQKKSKRGSLKTQGKMFNRKGKLRAIVLDVAGGRILPFKVHAHTATAQILQEIEEVKVRQKRKSMF